MALKRADFLPFAEKMQAAGLPDVVIRTFRHYYSQLATGRTGLIPESEIRPVTSLPDAETFPPSLAEVGRASREKAVLVKLNGGLGTSMGLHKAKSLLVVKDGLTFLDIIARQALQQAVPLVLMNSYNTRDDSLAALAPYSNLSGPLPLDFMQHKVPKVVQSDLSPAVSPQSPEQEWCPPGHGDLYTALVTTGMLDTLLATGFEYLFVSNGDNLGAAMDDTLLGYFVQNELPFMMEVADRTPANRKGGHLAQTLDGQLILRESAQCPAEDTASFQDISRHKYFNTNNLWINLPVLRDVMSARDQILGLAMIRNSKTIDPRDSTSTPVFQLETAMGSAIAVFAGAGSVRVPRTRFAPVKTTDGLLALRSDDYVLDNRYQIVPSPARTKRAVVVTLDPRFYKLIDDMEARFPEGAPSLVDCESFSVSGDVRFGKGVTCKGDVAIVNEGEGQRVIEDHTVCNGRLVLAKQSETT